VNQAQQHLDRGGFSGAVGAEKAKYFAAFYLQVSPRTATLLPNSLRRAWVSMAYSLVIGSILHLDSNLRCFTREACKTPQWMDLEGDAAGSAQPHHRKLLLV
jgi:hypothetical protein